MTEEKDFIMQDESIIDSKSVNVFDKQQIETNFLGHGNEDLEGKGTLSDEMFEKTEYVRMLVSTSNFQKQLKMVHENALYEICYPSDEKIENTALEKILRRLECIHGKCVECDDNLNDYLQLVHYDLKKDMLLSDWDSFRQSEKILYEWEPLYDKIVKIIEVIETLYRKVTHYADSITKTFANNLTRTCNLLDNNVDQLILSIPKQSILKQNLRTLNVCGRKSVKHYRL